MEMNAAHLHTEEESSRYVPARADATFSEADYRTVLCGGKQIFLWS